MVHKKWAIEMFGFNEKTSYDLAIEAIYFLKVDNLGRRSYEPFSGPVIRFFFFE